MKHGLLISFLLLLATACQYKELCYDHSHTGDISVVMDWSEFPEASPASMTVLFYNTDKEMEPERYDYSGKDGGKAKLVEGNYQAACYNNDTEAIRYRGMGSVATLEAYTRTSSIAEGTKLQYTKGDMPRAKGAEEEEVILEPDLLWGGAGALFNVVANQSQTTTIAPRELVRDLTITIQDVPNLQYTNGLGGSLTGLAGSVYVASGEIGENHVTQAFEVQKADETTLVIHIRIFGHCPHAEEGIENEHQLVIYAVLADGSQWYYTTDITGQMHDEELNPPEDFHIEVEIEDIPIPKPIVNGSGFQPTIDGWQGVEIDVGM